MRVEDLGTLRYRDAWALQERQAVLLDGANLYEVMEKVRGRREVQLEQLNTKVDDLINDVRAAREHDVRVVVLDHARGVADLRGAEDGRQRNI